MNIKTSYEITTLHILQINFHHAFHIYFLCTYCVPGTVLGIGDEVINKTDEVCFPGTSILVGKGRQ